MQVKVPFTWRQAQSSNFNQDLIRRTGKPYKAKRMKGFISKHTESDITTIKQWLKENQIKLEGMLGVFTVRLDAVYYDGLALLFANDDDVMLFRMRFS